MATDLNIPEISIVYPAYNEASGKRLYPYSANLNNALEAFDRSGLSHEIIVVDDGSTDSTAEVAKDFGVKVITHKDRLNHGKGAAVKLGLLSAQGALRAFADADGSYSPDTVLDLFDTLTKEGADIAAADRDSHATLGRRIIHFALEEVCNAIAPTDVPDTQAGAKAFTAEAVEAIWPHVSTDGYGADREALYIAHLLGMRTVGVEAPIERQVGDSHVRTKDALRLVLDSFTIRQRHAHRAGATKFSTA